MQDVPQDQSVAQPVAAQQPQPVVSPTEQAQPVAPQSVVSQPPQASQPAEVQQPPQPAQVQQPSQQPGVSPVDQVVTEHVGDKTVQTKQIGKYKVEVIREKCISAASCVAIAPGVFQLDEENLAIVISQDGNDDQTKLLAAQSCPTAAITVTDTETGQQVWPQV
jgi:ferredoxin